MPSSRAYRKRPGYSKRRPDVRSTRQRFLIYCEGKQTEPNYFRGFRAPKDVISLSIRGLGRDPVTLVNKTIRKKNDEEYDQTWCVFDRNTHSAQEISDAMTLAEKDGIQVAYSNESFELWYLLHFHYIDTAIDRQNCAEKLSSLLGHEYEKNSGTIYEQLRDRQPQAIENAKRLLAQYPSPNPVRDNPFTTVHLLVEQLNRFIR